MVARVRRGTLPSWFENEYEPRVRDFVVFLQDSYETIKKVNPKATVILGGISSYHCSCYLTELAKFKAYNYADGIGFHPYDASPEACSKDVTNWIQAVVDKLPRKLPIWITDWGWECDDPQPAGWVQGPNGKNGSQSCADNGTRKNINCSGLKMVSRRQSSLTLLLIRRVYTGLALYLAMRKVRLPIGSVYYSYKDPLRGTTK